MKKKFALLLCSTGNEAFAVGNVIIGAKKYLFHSLDNNEYDVIFYTDKLLKQDEKALRIIFPNIIINIYDSPLKNKGFDAISYYSLFTYARFESFDLLDSYEKIFYVDTDIIIQKDISHLLNLKEDFSICYYGEHIKIMDKIIHNVDKNTISELEKEGFNLQANEIQAGIYLINDTLYCYKELKNWLYNFCIKYKLNDEDAISIALNYFNIKVNKLDQRYNCIPSSDCNKDAFILHSIGSNKFWRGLYNKNWWDNHYQWVECGGSESFNDIEKKRKLIFKIMWFIPSTKLRNKLRAILLRYIGLSGR